MGSALSTTSDSEQAQLDNWRCILSNAPSDIVRLIFEIAAQEDMLTATSLALVSKEINSLVTPLLYKSVYLRSASDVQVFETGTAHLRYTKALILESNNVPDPLILRRSCIALRQMHIQCDSGYDLGRYTVFPDRLHQLVVHGFTSRQRAYAFLPIYSRLTHFAFMHDVPRYFPDDPAQAFPNLTHFACAYRVYGQRAEFSYITASQLQLELRFILDKVLRIPSLKIAVVLVQDFSRPDTLSMDDMHALLTEVPQKDCSEVVLLARSPLDDDHSKDMRHPEAWDACFASTFWALAEGIKSIV